MAGKSSGFSKFLLLLIIIVGGAGAAYYKKDELLPMIPPGIIPAGIIPGYPPTGEPVANSPESGAAIPTGMPAPTNPGANNMSNFDLTTDAEGLSKATATMTLEKGGEVKWRFYTNDAPNTVKRITQLISEGFYNGIVYHRVVPGFVVQAGDPSGTGSGGSGVKQKAEFNKHKHLKGIVSMARTSDPDSADSQFFIMLGTADSLDGKYTVIGKVVEGYENVEKIRQGDKIKTFVIQ